MNINQRRRNNFNIVLFKDFLFFRKFQRLFFANHAYNFRYVQSGTADSWYNFHQRVLVYWSAGKTYIQCMSIEYVWSTRQKCIYIQTTLTEREEKKWFFALQQTLKYRENEWKRNWMWRAKKTQRKKNWSRKRMKHNIIWFIKIFNHNLFCKRERKVSMKKKILNL